MTERPSPELKALAAELFAAARAERPAPALGRRLALIDPRHTRQQTPPLSTAAGGSAARGQRVRVGRAVLLAALVASGAGLWWVARQDTGGVLISAERTPEVKRSRDTLAPAPLAAPLATRDRPTPAASLPQALAPDAARNEDPPGARPSPARVASPPAPNTGGPTRVSAARDPSVSTRSREPRRALQLAAETRGSRSAGASTPSTGTPTSGAAAAGTRPASTLRRELELLEGSRAALRSGEARRALELLETHARERAGRTLVAEATLLRIEALAALGERSAASELARRFVNDNPHSALSDRARSFITPAAAAAP